MNNQILFSSTEKKQQLKHALETLRTRTIKKYIRIHLIDKEKAIVPLKAKR